MTGDSTLPGCFSLYPKPLPPNRCENCPYREDCQKFVSKEALKPILAKLAELKQTLQG